MNSKKMIAGCIFCFECLMGYSQSQLIVQAGTEIKLSANDYLVLENMHLINNGTINLISGNGTFKFSGNSITNISGTNKPLFNNIELAKSGSSQLVLQRDIDAWGSILFTAGILHLNNHVLDLGKFGYLTNENEASHAIGPTGGYIQWSDILNAPSSVNPGNLGAIITSTNNLGNTTIRRGHVSQTNSAGGGSSILRYFDIVPTNNTGLNATLQFNYLDAELNGLDENSLGLWKSSDLTHWSYIGFDSRNTASNFVSKTGIADFSRWTLSTPGNALPVHFSAFNTKCNGNSITARWTTETEMNSQSFEVQRSADGRNWTTIANLPAAGNSANSRQYSFTDNVYLQNSFYRIAEVDINGKINYSTINQVRCGNNAEFKLWPNPAISQTWLSVSIATDEKASLIIIDQKGRVVYRKQVSLFAGNTIINIDTHWLASGSYVVELIMKNNIRSTSLIKLH